MNITTNIVTDKPSQPNVINDLIEGAYIFSIVLIIISVLHQLIQGIQ